MSGNTFGTITLTGPAAGVTISNSNKDRDLIIDKGVAAMLSDLTLSSGEVSYSATLYGEGGAINNGGTLTLTHCTIQGNNAAAGGGIENRGDLTVNDSTISSNIGGNGAGIDNHGSLQITDSTIANNNFSTNGYGGGIYNLGRATITGCTLSGNNAYYPPSYERNAYAGLGGAIDNAGQLTITNSTISGNESVSVGGGIENSGQLAIRDTTITDNQNYAPADASDAGINNESGAKLSLANSIVAGNQSLVMSSTGTARVASDLSGRVTSLGHNLISDGDHSSGWISSDLLGSHSKPLDPRLSPLDFFGGPTETQVPLAGSPAIGGGSAALLPMGLATDQRGFNRVVDGVLDIGAVELQRAATVNLAPPSKQNVIAGENNTLMLGSFTDPGGKGPFQVIVNWGDGSQTDHFTRAAIGSLGSQSHFFFNTGNLTATVFVVDAMGDVSQPAHFPISSSPHPLVTLTVNTARDTTDPAGSAILSLRDALNIADHSFGPVVIQFDPHVFAKAQTISVDTSLTLSHNIFGTVSIMAPSAGLTVSGGFTLEGGTASISGISFTKVGIFNDGPAKLTLTQCTITGCSRAFGGGIYNVGTMSIVDSIVSKNHATGGYSDRGGGYYPGNGGGIFNASGAFLTITGSVLSNNSAGGSGGAIDNEGNLALNHSTISGNTAGNHGAIYNFNGMLTINQCSFQANISGGARYDGYPMPS